MKACHYIFYSVYKSDFIFKGTYLNYVIDVFFNGYRTEVFSDTITYLTEVNWFPDGNSWVVIEITNIITNEKTIFKDVNLNTINFSKENIK